MPERNKSAPVLVAIGVYSLVKAASLVLVAVGVHKLLKGNVADVLQHWLEAVRIDPETRLVHSLISKITGLSPHRLRALEVGTLLYAGLFSVEGLGLVLKKRWAEYVTIITTALLLPIEVYEIYHHVTAVRLGIFIANVIMVIYLVVNVRRK